MGEIQRLIMDGRVPNSFFLTPSIEHTSGDDLARMQVAEDRLLEVAKSDLSDHFHRCEALAALRAYFGLKGVSAETLCDVSDFRSRRIRSMSGDGRILA